MGANSPAAVTEWTWDRVGGRPVRRLTMGRASHAPELVVVPGLGACGYLRPLVEACAAWTRVHLLDVPGFGDRRTARCPSTVADVANVVGAWLESVPTRPVMLFGHSTGAQAALRVATATPGMVGVLVLAAPTFPPELRTWRGLVVPALRCLRREPFAEVGAVAPYYLRGKHDPFTTDRWAAELAGGHRCVTLPGAHNFPFTHPRETSAAIRASTARED